MSPKRTTEQEDARIEALKPSADEAGLTYDEIITARKAEKRKLLARTTPKPDEPVHVARTFDELNAKLDVAAHLAPFAEVDHAAIKARQDAVSAKAASEIQPLVKKARSVAAKYDQLLARHRDAVQSVASLDLAAIVKRVPLRIEFAQTVVRGKNSMADQVTNHNQIAQLHRLAQSLAATCAPRPGGVAHFDDLKSAVRQLENFLLFGYEWIDERGVSYTSTEFRQAKIHVEHFIAIAEKQLADATTGFETFARLSERVAGDLRGVNPADVTAKPEPSALAPLSDQEPVPRSSSSYQDFEPREVMRDEPVYDDTKTKKVGDRWLTKSGEPVKSGGPYPHETKLVN